jgi:hypothetical protein
MWICMFGPLTSQMNYALGREQRLESFNYYWGWIRSMRVTSSNSSLSHSSRNIHLDYFSEMRLLFQSHAPFQKQILHYI